MVVTIKIKDFMSDPIVSWGDFYTKAGCIALCDEFKAKYGYKMPISNHVLMNKKTQDKIIETIKYTYDWYGISRKDGKALTKHKTKIGNAKRMEVSIAFDCLGFAPTLREDVPDDELWVEVDRLKQDKGWNIGEEN